jgi:6-phosphofructokinase 1
MVALRGTEVVEVPIQDAVAHLKTVPEALYEVAEVFFG